MLAWTSTCPRLALQRAVTPGSQCAAFRAECSRSLARWLLCSAWPARVSTDCNRRVRRLGGQAIRHGGFGETGDVMSGDDDRVEHPRSFRDTHSRNTVRSSIRIL